MVLWFCHANHISSPEIRDTASVYSRQLYPLLSFPCLLPSSRHIPVLSSLLSSNPFSPPLLITVHSSPCLSASLLLSSHLLSSPLISSPPVHVLTPLYSTPLLLSSLHLPSIPSPISPSLVLIHLTESVE